MSKLYGIKLLHSNNLVNVTTEFSTLILTRTHDTRDTEVSHNRTYIRKVLFKNILIKKYTTDPPLQINVIGVSKIGYMLAFYNIQRENSQSIHSKFLPTTLN